MIQNTKQRPGSKDLSYSTLHAPPRGHTHCWPGHLRYCIESSQHRAWQGTQTPGFLPSTLTSPCHDPATEAFSLWTKLICMVSSRLCTFSRFHTYPLALGGVGSPITGLQLTRRHQSRRHQSRLLGSLPAWPGWPLGANHLHVKIMSVSQVRGPTTASFITGCRGWRGEGGNLPGFSNNLCYFSEKLKLLDYEGVSPHQEA